MSSLDFTVPPDRARQEGDDDPADYEIGHINLNPEVHVPQGSFAQIGMSVVDWQLEILP